MFRLAGIVTIVAAAFLGCATDGLGPRTIITAAFCLLVVACLLAAGTERALLLQVMAVVLVDVAIDAFSFPTRLEFIHF